MHLEFELLVDQLAVTTVTADMTGPVLADVIVYCLVWVGCN